jgi:cytochrome c5
MEMKVLKLLPFMAAAALFNVSAASAAPAANAASLAKGEQVFKSTCGSCHATGVMGAPKLGDKAAWAPRIAKGKATVYGSALNGFKMMPAKGGNPGLKDDEVKAVVDYMFSKAS